MEGYVLVVRWYDDAFFADCVVKVDLHTFSELMSDYIKEDFLAERLFAGITIGVIGR